jgi:hypothetical protein
VDTYYLHLLELERETIKTIMLKNVPLLQHSVDERSFSLCDTNTVGNVSYLNIVNGKRLQYNLHAPLEYQSTLESAYRVLPLCLQRYESF